MTKTIRAIRELRIKAGEHGDSAQVALCDRVLSGNYILRDFDTTQPLSMTELGIDSVRYQPRNAPARRLYAA